MGRTVGVAETDVSWAATCLFEPLCQNLHEKPCKHYVWKAHRQNVFNIKVSERCLVTGELKCVSM
jgi:hypothetical protein